MLEVKEYRILVEFSSIVLEKAVMSKLAQGWIPQGGVSIAVYRDNGLPPEFYYTQAMVKY